ncbi:MAG: hypothetical protein R6V52_12335 [Bacteroidales bacterium]
MTTKDFFILIIKLFGLYSIIITLFSILPGSVGLMGIYPGFTPFVMIGAIIAFAVFLLVLLIFKAPHLVRLLKLEKDFDSDYIKMGNLNADGIIKIAAFILGGLLIVQNLPQFVQQLIVGFGESVQSMYAENTGNWDVWVSGFNVLIGYLLITNLDFIARIFHAKKKAGEQE